MKERNLSEHYLIIYFVPTEIASHSVTYSNSWSTCLSLPRGGIRGLNMVAHASSLTKLLSSHPLYVGKQLVFFNSLVQMNSTFWHSNTVSSSKKVTNESHFFLSCTHNTFSILIMANLIIINRKWQDTSTYAFFLALPEHFPLFLLLSKLHWIHSSWVIVAGHSYASLCQGFRLQGCHLSCHSYLRSHLCSWCQQCSNIENRTPSGRSCWKTYNGFKNTC